VQFFPTTPRTYYIYTEPRVVIGKGRGHRESNRVTQRDRVSLGANQTRALPTEIATLFLFPLIGTPLF